MKLFSFVLFIEKNSAVDVLQDTRLTPVTGEKIEGQNKPQTLSQNCELEISVCFHIWFNSLKSKEIKCKTIWEAHKRHLVLMSAPVVPGWER